MTNVTAVQIPDFVAGTWDIDPAHSEVSSWCATWS